MTIPAEDVATQADQIALAVRNCYTLDELNVPRRSLTKLQNSVNLQMYEEQDQLLIGKFIGATHAYCELREIQIRRGEAGKRPFLH